MSLKCPFIRYMNILMEVMTAASAHSGTYMPKKEEARQHLLLQISYKVTSMKRLDSHSR